MIKAIKTDSGRTNKSKDIIVEKSFTDKQIQTSYRIAERGSLISQNKDDFTFKNINLNVSAHSNFGDAFKYSSGNMPDSGNSK